VSASDHELTLDVLPVRSPAIDESQQDLKRMNPWSVAVALKQGLFYVPHICNFMRRKNRGGKDYDWDGIRGVISRYKNHPGLLGQTMKFPRPTKGRVELPFDNYVIRDFYGYEDMRPNVKPDSININLAPLQAQAILITK